MIGTGRAGRRGLRQRSCKLPNPKGYVSSNLTLCANSRRFMYKPRELIGILERQEFSVGESMDDRGNPIYWITGRDGMLGALSVQELDDLQNSGKLNLLGIEGRLEERRKENNL